MGFLLALSNILQEYPLVWEITLNFHATERIQKKLCWDFASQCKVAFCDKLTILIFKNLSVSKTKLYLKIAQ